MSSIAISYFGNLHLKKKTANDTNFKGISKFSRKYPFRLSNQLHSIILLTLTYRLLCRQCRKFLVVPVHFVSIWRYGISKSNRLSFFFICSKRLNGKYRTHILKKFNKSPLGWQHKNSVDHLLMESSMDVQIQSKFSSKWNCKLTVCPPIQNGIRSSKWSKWNTNGRYLNSTKLHMEISNFSTVRPIHSS